jgi:hypothetical protein
MVDGNEGDVEGEEADDRGWVSSDSEEEATEDERDRETA